MDKELVTLLWLIGGILLVGSEVFVPGIVAVFLGLSALLVAGLRWIGLVEGIGMSFFVWMTASVVMTLGLRRTIVRWFPPETNREPHQPELKAYGQVVEVLENVNDNAPGGRIRFEGTSWQAMSTAGAITAGSRARLVYRDNLTWLVEPVSDEELAALPSPEQDKPTD